MNKKFQFQEEVEEVEGNDDHDDDDEELSRGLKFLYEFIALGHIIFHILMSSFSSLSLDLSDAMRSDLILMILIKRGFGLHNPTIKGQRSFKSLNMCQNSTIKSSVASMNFRSGFPSIERKEET